MSKNVQMAANIREGSGKGAARTLRRENRIPAVIYGDNKAPVMISLEEKPITLEYLKGHLFTSLCDLTVDKTKHLVLVRDVQLDPVTDRIVHADFLRVTPKTSVRINVPVHVTGQDASAALKAGGVLTIIHHEVELMCPATDIPEEVTVSVADLKIGESVKLSELNLPKGTKYSTAEPDAMTILTITAPRAEEDLSKPAVAAGEVPATNVAAPAAAAAADAAKAKKDPKKK